MRVLMISKACVVSVYRRKLEEMSRLGISLTVVVPPGWRDERGWLPLEDGHTRGYSLRVTPMAFNGSFHLHYYPRLWQVMCQERPDIVHVDEEAYNLATWHAVWLAGRLKARSLFFSWQNLHRRYPPPFCWGERYVYRHVDGAIAGSREVLQVLRDKGYRGPACVIPQFGVDPTLYGRADAPKKRFVIGYVGRLVPEKGIADLLHAVAALPGNWHVRLLGSGPDRKRLIGLAHSLGIVERVSFDGQIPSSQVPLYLQKLHVLVLPSHTSPHWKEQFGRVLVEAMISGVPVIGSDSGQIPEVIGDAGLLFPEGDERALRRRLQSLMHDPSLWYEMSQRGRRRAMERFTQAQVAARTVSFYKSLLSP